MMCTVAQAGLFKNRGQECHPLAAIKKTSMDDMLILMLFT